MKVSGLCFQKLLLELSVKCPKKREHVLARSKEIISSFSVFFCIPSLLSFCIMVLVTLCHYMKGYLCLCHYMGQKHGA